MSPLARQQSSTYEHALPDKRINVVLSNDYNFQVTEALDGTRNTLCREPSTVPITAGWLLLRNVSSLMEHENKVFVDRFEYSHFLMRGISEQSLSLFKRTCALYYRPM